MNKIKDIHIFGGGTVAHISNHFAVTAPAYGTTAKEIYEILYASRCDMDVFLHLTKMAGGKELETNEDIVTKIEELKKDNNTKIIFFNCAMVDFQPDHLNACANIYNTSKFGKYEKRLSSRKNKWIDIHLVPSEKII